MLLTLRTRLRWMRRYECDIWGYCYTDERVSYIYQNFLSYPSRSAWKKNRPVKEILIYRKKIHLLKSEYFSYFYLLWLERRILYRKRKTRYIYRFDYPVKWRPPKKYNYRFLSIRLTRLYFFNFYEHQFRRMFRSSARKDGQFEVNYLSLLECRAVSILYRLNFSADLIGLFRTFRACKSLRLEYTPVESPNFIIPVGLLFTLLLSERFKTTKYILKRIQLRTLLFPIPKFIFTCFTCFFFYMVRGPSRRDLVYPFAIDLQRLTGYY